MAEKATETKTYIVNTEKFEKCKYADLTLFGLVCKSYEDYWFGCIYYCPDYSGTDGKGNKICYSYVDEDGNYRSCRK